MMFANVKCMRCGEAATHKFVRIEEGGPPVDIFLCAKHAAQASPYQKAQAVLPADIGIGEILAQFLGNPEGLKGSLKAHAGLQCKTCGLPFFAYKKTLFLGCPDCYDSFFQALLPELQRMHRATKHVGRRPGGGMESPVAGALPEPELRPPVALPAPLMAEEELEVEDEIDEDADLEGDPEEAIADLTREMKKAIAEEDFETAARCRDEIGKIRERVNKLA